MTIHILIPTCGIDRLLQGFCESFVRWTPSSSVYLVCNTADSQDARCALKWTEYLTENGFDCTFLRYHERIGYMRACNAAWRVMDVQNWNDYMVVLNDDLVFEGDWIGPLCEVISHKAAMGIPCLVGPSLKYVGLDGFGYDTPKGRYAYIEGWCVMGDVKTMMLFRTPYPASALFDTAFVPTYCEDVDLSIRVLEAGGTLQEVPVSIRHLRNETTGRDRELYWAKNRELLQRKWHLAGDLMPGIEKIAKPACPG